MTRNFGVRSNWYYANWTRSTWALVLLFALTEVGANWLAATYKLAVGPLLIPAGAFLIPASLLLRDQLHLRHPFSALWASLGVGVLVSGAFGAGVFRVAVASIVAFCVSFAVDTWVFQKLSRRPMEQRMRWSNWASLPVDTLVFVPVAFAGLFPLGALIAGQIVAKLFMTELTIFVWKRARRG